MKKPPPPQPRFGYVTHYNGTDYRSRLEARWAAFFCVTCMAYDYEPERFFLKDGRSYTPDFRVNGADYVEIKPQDEFIINAETEKAVLLKRERPELSIIVIGGKPNYDCLIYRLDLTPADECVWQPCEIRQSAQRDRAIDFAENMAFEGVSMRDITRQRYWRILNPTP